MQATAYPALIPQGSRLLDVACGPGFVSEAAAARGTHPVGVDIATAMVERARMRRPDLTFVVGDALRLPFPEASFDAITMNFGILHVSQPERALAEAHRVLVPGGRLAFTTWLAEGNAEDEITEAALAAHAIASEGPEGPSYYVFADRDECLRAHRRSPAGAVARPARGSRAAGSTPARCAWTPSPHSGACRAQTSSSKHSSTPESAFRAMMADAVRRYADGEEFALPIAARLISARASGPAGDGQAERDRQ
jgi:SAM-dependent methyltransferase